MEKLLDKVKKYVYSVAKKPNQRLSERDVAKRFNLKRNNVREIFISLEGEGFLQRLPQVGYELVDYQQTDRRTVMAVRYAVEKEAARKALDRSSREDILRLTLILEEMEKILKDKNGNVESFCKLDIEFHKALIKASGDNMLLKIFEFITAPIFKSSVPLKELTLTHSNHMDILDSLKNKDEKKLLKNIDAHLGNYEKIKD